MLNRELFTLKDQLEREWQRPGVRSAWGKVLWSTRKKSRLWQPSDDTSLYFREKVEYRPNTRKITKKLVAKATRR